MEPAAGASNFQMSGDAYDSFMGRYSQPLAIAFLDAVGIEPGRSVLDVGCGPGALTGELVRRLGAAAVAGADPSPPFVADCAARYPGVDVRLGRAEAIPFGDDTFDAALAQLVLHFVSEPELAAAEMCRVVRPDGLVAACMWDFAEGMQMLHQFWEAALVVVPDAPVEARAMRFGRAGEIVELFSGAGLRDVVETTLHVSSTYASFDELWAGYLARVGPAGSFCASLSDEQRSAVRDGLFERVGRPSGSFSLNAMAHSALGRSPH